MTTPTTGERGQMTNEPKKPMLLSELKWGDMQNAAWRTAHEWCADGLLFYVTHYPQLGLYDFYCRGFTRYRLDPLEAQALLFKLTMGTSEGNEP